MRMATWKNPFINYSDEYNKIDKFIPVTINDNDIFTKDILGEISLILIENHIGFRYESDDTIICTSNIPNDDIVIILRSNINHSLMLLKYLVSITDSDDGLKIHKISLSKHEMREE